MQDNADSVLAVRFYAREMENEFLTTAEGRPIKYMADFVRIEIPGNMLSIIDTVANDGHKERFPLQWARYQNSKGSGDVQGTLLHDWNLLTPAQASELKHFKFYTVEQVANASDQQINALGMAAGMSPFAFRDKARAFLAASKDSGIVMQQAEELARRDLEIKELREQMNALMARLSEPEKRSPGRPRKEAEQA